MVAYGCYGSWSLPVTYSKRVIWVFNSIPKLQFFSSDMFGLNSTVREFIFVKKDTDI